MKLGKVRKTASVEDGEVWLGRSCAKGSITWSQTKDTSHVERNEGVTVGDILRPLNKTRHRGKGRRDGKTRKKT